VLYFFVFSHCAAAQPVEAEKPRARGMGPSTSESEYAVSTEEAARPLADQGPDATVPEADKAFFTRLDDEITRLRESIPTPRETLEKFKNFARTYRGPQWSRSKTRASEYQQKILATIGDQDVSNQALRELQEWEKKLAEKNVGDKAKERQREIAGTTSAAVVAAELQKIGPKRDAANRFKTEITNKKTEVQNTIRSVHAGTQPGNLGELTAELAELRKNSARVDAILEELNSEEPFWQAQSDNPGVRHLANQKLREKENKQKQIITQYVEDSKKNPQRKTSPAQIDAALEQLVILQGREERLEALKEQAASSPLTREKQEEIDEAEAHVNFDRVQLNALVDAFQSGKEFIPELAEEAKEITNEGGIQARLEALVAKHKNDSSFDPGSTARAVGTSLFFFVASAQDLIQRIQSGPFAPLIDSLGITAPEITLSEEKDVAATLNFASPIAGYAKYVGFKFGVRFQEHSVSLSVYVANLNSFDATRVPWETFNNSHDNIVRLSELEEQSKTQYGYFTAPTDAARAGILNWGYAFKLGLPQGWVSEKYPALKKMDELGLISPILVLSTFPYFDPELGIVVEPGLAILAKINLSGPFKELGEFVHKTKPYIIVNADQLIVAMSIPTRDIKRTHVRAELQIQAGANFQKAYEEGKLKDPPSFIKSIVTDKIILDIQPATLNFEMRCGVILSLMTQRDPIILRAGVKVAPSLYHGLPAGISLSFYGKMDGLIKNIFGIEGIGVGDLGLQIDMDTVGAVQLAKFGIPSPVTGLGLRGRLLISAGDEPISLSAAGAVSFKDNPLPEFIISAHLGSLPLTKLLGLFAQAVHVKPPTDWKIPNISLDDCTFEVVTRDMNIAAKSYTRGFKGAGSIHINDFQAGFSFEAQVPEGGPKMFMGYGFMTEIDARFIKITGNSEQYSFVPGGKSGPFFFFQYMASPPTPADAQNALANVQRSIGQTIAHLGRKTASGFVSYFSIINNWTLPTLIASGQLVIKPWQFSIMANFIFSQELISADFGVDVGTKFHARMKVAIPPFVFDFTKFKLRIEFEQDFWTPIREAMEKAFQKEIERVRAKLNTTKDRIDANKRELEAFQRRILLSEGDKVKSLREAIEQKQKQIEETKRQLEMQKARCSWSNLAACASVVSTALTKTSQDLSVAKNNLQIQLEQASRKVSSQAAASRTKVQNNLINAEKEILKLYTELTQFIADLASFEIKKIILDLDSSKFIALEEDPNQEPKGVIEYMYKGQLHTKEWKVKMKGLLNGEDDTSQLSEADLLATQLMSQDIKRFENLPEVDTLSPEMLAGAVLP
jgi:hypothetical protein